MASLVTTTPMSLLATFDGIPTDAWTTFAWAGRRVSLGLRQGLNWVSPGLVAFCHKIGTFFQNPASPLFVLKGLIVVLAVTVPIYAIAMYSDLQHQAILTSAEKIGFICSAVFISVFALNIAWLMVTLPI